MNSISMRTVITLAISLFVVFGALYVIDSKLNVAEAWGSSCGSCGEGGGGEGGGHEPRPIPKPVCTMNVNATTIQKGTSIVLAWETTNAYAVTISGLGQQPADGALTLTPTQTTTYTLTAVGSGGNVTCSKTVTVTVPKPVCTMNVSLATITKGQKVTLTWATTNATAVSITNVGSGLPVDGSRVVTPTQTTTYTLTASGSGGSVTCTKTITVTVPKPVAKCDSFTANRSTVPAGGGNITLTWNTTNATSVSINQGIGNVSADGSRSVFVDSNKTFTLTASGTGGNDTCTVTITVEQQNAAKCDFLDSNKTVVDKDGENVTLSWGTTNATSVSINQGIGNVSADGSKTVFVDSDTTFTLTASGTNGNDTCTVTVRTDKDVKETPRCDFLRIKGDDNNLEVGDKITLEWQTTNADDVEINPQLGDVPVDGSDEVTITDDNMTFTLTARNDKTNDEDTCRVTINADEEEKDNEDRPRCELDISKDRVTSGQKVTLSWETNDADEITIKDNHGKTIFDTDDYSKSQRKKYFDGEIDVIVTRDTVFTLKAEGDGGSRTCKVDVEVDDLAVYEKRDQGLVIALTQVPYTGFEAGPVLSFLFYAVLTLWALFIAYILVIKKGSVMGFSLYGAKGSGITSADIVNRKKVEALVEKYSGRLWK